MRRRARSRRRAWRSAPGGAFEWAYRPAAGEVARVRRERSLFPTATPPRSSSSRSAFVASLARTLARGVALFVDYGFPRREYYHPQRTDGTLMCHYRHRAHDDPFFLPGLQDITAHVDFTAIAEAARDAGAEVLGYTDAGAVPRELRADGGDVADSGRGREAVSAARRRRQQADQPVGDGRALQGDRVRTRRRRTISPRSGPATGGKPCSPYSTYPKRLLNDSASVGWAKIASRSTGVGHACPASRSRSSTSARRPRCRGSCSRESARSAASTIAFMKPRVSSISIARAT